MIASHDPSVEDLRKESERTRAALTNTVSELRERVSDATGELRTRVSPAYIKEEIRDYVHETTDSLAQSLERKVRDNPLQAIAVGAALAYPLWGVVRAMPTPILLLGAGIWFAGKGGKHSIHDATAKVGDVVEAATARASDWTSSAQIAASHTLKRVSDPIAEMGAAVASGVHSVGDKARASAHNVRDSVAGIGETALNSLSNAATAAADTVSGALSTAKTKASAIGEQSRTGFVDLVDRNPLLVAGVGLAIGAFIAASLPSSEVENQLLGKPSDDLKSKASGIAARGIEQTKQFAADVAGDVAAAVVREGLDPSGIQKSVKDLTQSVKAVADRGLQTALGGEPTSQPSS